MKKTDNNNVVSEVRDHRFLLVLIFAILVLSLYILSNVQLFGDGLVHHESIEQILESGTVSYDSAVGHRDFYINPLSAEPKTYQPPNYYILASVLAVGTGDVQIAMEILVVLGQVLLVSFVYFVLSRVMNKEAGIIGAIMVAFAAMTAWNIGHRLMEPMIFAVMVGAVWLFIEKRDTALLVAALGAFLLFTKISGLVFMIGILLAYLLTKKFKKAVLIGILMSVLCIPMVVLTYRELGTIYPSPNGLPVIKNVFDSYTERHWNESEWEQELAEVAGEGSLLKGIQTTDATRLPFLKDHVEEHNVFGIAQYFTVLPIDISLPNSHWYGYKTLLHVLTAVLLFGVGLAGFVWGKREKRSDSMHEYIVVWASISAVSLMVYFGTLALQRYLYFMNILSVFLMLGWVYFKNSYIRLLSLGATFFIMTYLLFFSLSDITSYSNSLKHEWNTTPGISLEAEFEEFSQNIDLSGETCIFTPYSGIRFYTGVPMKWDSRLLKLDGEEFQSFSREYGCTYVLIPSSDLDNENYTVFFENCDVEGVYQYFTVYSLR